MDQIINIVPKGQYYGTPQKHTGMKTTRIILLSGLILLITGVADGFSQTPDTLKIPAETSEKSDTTEYELIIMDPGFQNWFLKHSKPKHQYSEAFLENWNKQLVSQWNNISHTSSRARCLPVSYIDYDASISYGLELNYKLFYYFRFIHERCHIFTHHPPRWGL